MQQFSVAPAVLLLLCGTFLSRARLEELEPETPDWRKTLKTIRNGIHKIDTFLNYALDLIGGSDGLCQFKCSDGVCTFYIKSLKSLLSDIQGILHMYKYLESIVTFQSYTFLRAALRHCHTAVFLSVIRVICISLSQDTNPFPDLITSTRRPTDVVLPCLDFM